ncbi:NACHT domain-containing protein [Leptolyngbya ohadii]|uniref:NACHT domain-containing protein n=1 Tax=Leptolyngbya ohadii TaxID=1962290 RepID=UPI000B5A1F6C|nr:NACHT domain-containing NTPase [Leptolyngbya ohadii]
MAKRSLKASEAGIKRAKQAFRYTGWTQEYLASAVGLETRQSIWKFFSGRPIERHVFIEICFQLNLDWEEIVAPPDLAELAEAEASDGSIDRAQELQPILQKVRDSILSQCDLLQVSLDTAYPLAVEQVYTQVQVLPTPSSQRWLEVSHLQAEAQRTPQGELDPHDRLLMGQQSNRLGILDLLSTHNRFVILGKPGAGKTTLLQHLAIQCVNGKIYSDRIPLFLSLRAFAAEARMKGNFNLEHQLREQWTAIGLTAPQMSDLLQNGRLLVLLDGLDEVPQQESSELSYQIQKFAETYPQVALVMTCRVAAQDYQFRGFTYGELADFDALQIAAVARKWFVAMSRGENAEAIGLAKAEQFLQHLERPENEPIREMVTTPLLLHLACLVFHERAMFPPRRAKLYQAGLDILLVRWDKVRGIQRDLGTDRLSLPETLNLLSQIAATLFEQGKSYFEKSELLPILTEFLQTLPQASTDPETLWLTSEAVLRSIALQSGLLVERARGIYSFSHLTFQEYLTARRITARCMKENTLPLEQLARHMTEQRWREVILLTLSLLPKANPLLKAMKQEVDRQLGEHEILQQAMQWVNQKAETAPRTYQAVAVKAFYLPLCCNQDISLALALDDRFAFDLEPPLGVDLAIARTYHQIQQMGAQPTYEQILNLWFALDFGRQFPQQAPLHAALEQLKAEFPSLGTDAVEWLLWWQNNRKEWIDQFEAQILRPHHLNFGWGLSPLEKKLLWEYYQSNRFLVNCLNSECSVDSVVRSQIEAALLSEPLAESSALLHEEGLRRVGTW